MLNLSSQCKPAAGGFSLLEVLIATGIFAIGAVAVASIFPVAILLQSRTVEEITSTHFSKNAEALIGSRGFKAAAATDWDPLRNDGVTGLDVAPMPLSVFNDWWLAYDRSYGVLDDIDFRRDFWVPLIRDDDPTVNEDWQVFIFTVRGGLQSNFGSLKSTAFPGFLNWANNNDPEFVPGVAEVSVTPASNAGGEFKRFAFTNVSPSGDLLIRVGDAVLANDGVTYRVERADNSGVEVRGFVLLTTTSIWFAHPGDGSESTFVGLKEFIFATDGTDPSRLVVP